MIVILILAVVLAFFGAMAIVPRLLGKISQPKVKSEGEKEGGEKKDWGKYRQSIAIPVTIILLLVFWRQLWPGSFSRTTATGEFWVGFLLVVVVWGFLLTIPKPFEKRWSRKVLAASALLGGLCLMA